MRRGGRLRKSNRSSERGSISRPPNYNPRQPTSKPPIEYRSLAGDGSSLRSRFTGQTPKRTKRITGKTPGRIPETREEREE